MESLSNLFTEDIFDFVFNNDDNDAHELDEHELNDLFATLPEIETDLQCPAHSDVLCQAHASTDTSPTHASAAIIKALHITSPIHIHSATATSNTPTHTTSITPMHTITIASVPGLPLTCAF